MVSPADQDVHPKSEGIVPAGGRAITINQGRIDSRDLFVGTREITIAHGDDVYRLRLTSQNKLILTK